MPIRYSTECAVTCDGCGADGSEMEQTINQRKRELKERGWVFKKGGVCYCPTCVGMIGEVV